MSFSVLAKKATNVPKEKFGKADPYCQVIYQGQKKKTKVIKDSDSPEWNENLSFDLAGKQLSGTDSIDVELKDWERIGSDKLIGKAVVAARDLISKKQIEVSLPLSDKNGRPTGATVDLTVKYDAPAASSSSGNGGGGGGSGGGVDAVDGGLDDEDDEPEGEIDDPNATPEQQAASAAKKRKRSKQKLKAKLSTKATDFQVRVKVVEARQLEGSNVHPVCKITLFGETKTTRVKRATGSPIWNEVFYYSNVISPAEIVDEMLNFEVFNSKRLRSDALIGSFTCDCGLIYQEDGNYILNKWLLLSHPEEEGGVRGYLKICVAILGPGVDAPSFKAKPGGAENEDIEANLLMPAGMTLAPATFSLKAYQAEDLPRMDSAMLEGVKNFFSVGKSKPKELSDPYMIFSFAGQEIQSKVLYETYSPEFNEELKLAFKFPSVAENLTIRLYDWDRIGNELIATSIIKVSQICLRSSPERIGIGYLPTFGPCYVNFYGSTREFSELGDDFEALNRGTGEGVAYRGRILVELKTALEDKPEVPVSDIDVEDLTRVSKYMRRHKFVLNVAFLEATMICDTDAPVEFEVSVGTYGNKLDDTVLPTASCTQPTNAVFDGCRYNFLPWENNKPCIAVESFWEDITFRHDTVNMMWALVDMMDTRFQKVKTAQKANLPEIEVKSMLYSLMDELAEKIAQPLPIPQGAQLENELDKLMRSTRQAELQFVLEDMEKIKRKDPEVAEILTELGTVRETLKAQTVEPQDSIPDVFVWMLVGNKRKAYFRLPAHEIMYSPNGHSGKSCAKDMTIILKYPGNKGASKWQIPAKLRVKFWMGKKKYEDQWSKAQTEKVVVMAETYENQVALLGKWVTRGPAMTRPKWSDSTGELKLEKDNFQPPPGWAWADDWVVSPELSLLYNRDAGHNTFIEDVFELHTRLPGTSWSHAKVFWTDALNDTMPSKEDMELPEGWKWDADWTVDMNRGVDDEGYEYCVESTVGGFGPVEKTYHLSRRRRWTRQRTLTVDPEALKQQPLTPIAGPEGALKSLGLPYLTPSTEKQKDKQKVSEGWEYAPLFNMKFHAKESKMDLVRRRRWHRKMVPTGPDVQACTFSFQDSDDSSSDSSSESSSGSDAKEKAIAGCLAAPRMFLEASEKNKYQLRAYIYQARSIPAADDNARSDPYAAVSFGTQSQLTKVLKKTLSPMWDQTLIFDELTLYGSPEHIAQNPPEVVIEIFDEDLIGKDEYLGRAICKPMVKVSMSDERTCVLQWHSLTNLKGDAGELLASFELLLGYQIPANQSASLMDLADDAEMMPVTSQLMNGEDLPFAPPKRGDHYIVPTGIRPIMRRTAVEILCWGMRNMKKYQLLSITSPSVEFEIGEAVAQSPIIKNTRKNPNFSEALLFVDTMLPKEEYFMPPVSLRVRDHRAFGRKPTVGMHVIRSLEKYLVGSSPSPTYNPEGLSDQAALEASLDAITASVDGMTNGQQPLVENPETILDIPDTEKPPPPDMEDIDWWCKYYTSIGEEDKALKYVQMGFDTILMYDCELEDVPEFEGFTDFCDTFQIMSGSADDEEGQEVIGEFKGTFKVYELPEDPNEPLPPRHLDRLPSPAPEECVVRVYLIQAYDLQPADPNGLADPFLEVKLGKKTISLRDNYHANTLNPIFGEMLEFKCILPLQKDLKIIVKDYDLLTSDDPIGETNIDLENRFLSKYRAICGVHRTYCSSGICQWRDALKPSQILEEFCNRHRLAAPVYGGNTQVSVAGRNYTLQQFENNKETSHFWGETKERLACYVLNGLPIVKEHIETRVLRNKLQPTFDQGKLQMWVDIFPKSVGPPGPPINISARVPKKYQLRVIIWNTTDVILDETNLLGEQMSDIYVKGWLPGTSKQKTDVHYRSLDGDGNFNWRFVFPFEYLPAEQVLVNKKKEHFWSLDETEERTQPIFSIQIWDNDLISADDFLGSVELNLNAMPKPAKTSKNCKLTKLPDFNPQVKLVSLFDQKKLNGFWPCYQMTEGNPELTGKVEMEIELVTEEEAEAKPAGVARDEPNMNPVLQPPNRPATSFFFLSNPLKSCKHIIWRNYKWYIIGFIVVVLLIALLAIFIYSFPKEIWPLIFGKN
ncbi:myoferlin-like isoform X2 [Watersipora subatra]|uniref:myoferlin-like isoform X2 n=1 Tax=Watersipora subatra TaxID=2589382 RepID=UPI00355C8F10